MKVRKHSYPPGYLVVLKNKRGVEAFCDFAKHNNPNFPYVAYPLFRLAEYQESRAFLISFENQESSLDSSSHSTKIHAIALATQSKSDNRSSRAGFRINCRKIILFHNIPSPKWEDFFDLNSVQEGLGEYFFPLEESDQKKEVPAPVWARITDALKKDFHTISDDIEEILAYTKSKQTGHASDVLGLEQDCAINALDFTGISESHRNWKIKRIEENESWLEMINKPNEDQLIDFDASIFGNWKEFSRKPALRTFYGNNRRVAIMNVNRRPLEKVMGVDLVYFHHDYNAFVMIQYKKQLPEVKSARKDGSRTIFRIDSQFKEDLERMKNTLIKIKEFDLPTSKNKLLERISSYRVFNNPFYFKFCSADGFTIRDTSVPGFYVPQEYVELYLESDESLGDKGGRVIKENIRNINNDGIIHLIQNGFLGTKGIDCQAIQSLIESLLDRGDSVMLAEARRV